MAVCSCFCLLVTVLVVGGYYLLLVVIGGCSYCFLLLAVCSW